MLEYTHMEMLDVLKDRKDMILLQHLSLQIIHLHVAIDLHDLVLRIYLCVIRMTRMEKRLLIHHSLEHTIHSYTKQDQELGNMHHQMEVVLLYIMHGTMNLLHHRVVYLYVVHIQ